MGSFLGPEKIPKLLRVGDGEVQLPASAASPTFLNIGGRQYALTSPLSCIPSTTGVGGSELGSTTAFTILYHFAVVQGGVLGIIANETGLPPSGFSASRFLGSYNVTYSNVYGGLLHDSEMVLQEIAVSVADDSTLGYSPGLSNGQNSYALFKTVHVDTHRNYNQPLGIWYTPIAKNYSGSAMLSVSGTYASQGVWNTAIRAEGAGGIGDVVSKQLRNAAASSPFSIDANFENRFIEQGVAMRVTGLPQSWSSVTSTGSIAQNLMMIKG